MRKPHPMTSLSVFDLDRTSLRSQADVWSGDDNPARRRYMEKVRDVLPRLPAIDRDLLRMYVIDGRTQRQIRAVLGITQQGVCKRIASAFRRAEFLVGQPSIVDDLDTMLRDVVGTQEAEVLKQFGTLGCQSAVATKSALSLQWVNCLCLRGMDQLTKHTSLRAHYLLAWFLGLSTQRYLYDGKNRPTS